MLPIELGHEPEALIEALRWKSTIVIWVTIIGGILVAVAGGCHAVYRIKLDRARDAQAAKEKARIEKNADTRHSDEMATEKAHHLEELGAIERLLDPFRSLARRRYPSLSSEEALERLQNDIGALQKQVEQLESAAAPRRISADQSNRFQTDFAPCAVWIAHVTDNAEAEQFAGDLFALLKRSEALTVRHGGDFSHGGVTGLVMDFNPEKEPRCAGQIQRALNDIGITALGRPVPNLAAGEIYLRVGPKPLQNQAAENEKKDE